MSDRLVYFASCARFFASGASAREGFAPDDCELLPALERRGYRVEPHAWDAPHVRWEQARAVVVRSTWDYVEKPHEFSRWIDELRKLGVRVWNPASVLRWNLDKRYLLELRDRGVAIVPTLLHERDELAPEAAAAELARALNDAGWERAVLKPAVSAGARETHRIGPGDSEAYRRLRAEGAVLLQPFLEEIPRDGEWSFVFFGREFSHALVKLPRAGDFRVQSMHGGSVRVANPSPAWVAWARSALDAVEANLLYARVDAVILGGQPHLMELELLEPELFARVDPGAPERFAKALDRALEATEWSRT